MSIERMIGAIKEAGKGAVNAGRPVEISIGTVTSVSPVSVILDQRLPLTSDFLILTSYVEPLKVHIGGTDYMVRPGLQIDDKVVLVRVQGGQQYVVLDKVVNV